MLRVSVLQPAGNGFTLFNIPRGKMNVARRKKWIINVDRKDLVPTENTMLFPTTEEPKVQDSREQPPNPGGPPTATQPAVSTMAISGAPASDLEHAAGLKGTLYCEIVVFRFQLSVHSNAIQRTSSFGLGFFKTYSNL
ncbi:hypothetical protein HPB52_025392 [Rhipicephalus sanguineus]|uniref:Uncharacterized protein n=1 Tax=Rhipicephalus sanguineus TaxID=34632 RepID=A0A9D4YRG0_RHISA|nr:hypothetical protein HPB52_025392 [Rhipicephalus sanguineus]